MSRLELEGMLQRLKMQRMELQTKAATKITAIKQALSMSAIRQIDEIDIEGVKVLADELWELKQAMVENLSDAAKIKRDLDN